MQLQMAATPRRLEHKARAIKNFELDLLSERELGILDLAIDGLTDQQIGHKLGITPSTVNSYWVRIRGKLGHLSRTELVSRIVQQRANSRSSDLDDKITELENEISRLEATNDNSENANILKAAFDVSPEVCVVFNEDGRVILANEKFAELFELSDRKAEGLMFDEFFASSPNRSDPLDWSLLLDGSIVGLHYPLFGVKRDSKVFRVFLLVGKAEVDGQFIFSCVVRIFLDQREMPDDREKIAAHGMSSAEMTKNRILT